MTPRAMLLYIAGTIGACTVIATAWVKVGGPVPASTLYVTQSGEPLKRSIQKIELEGRKHSKESAKWGRKIYTKEVHDLLVLPAPADVNRRQYWQEQIEDAKRKKLFYENLEIELRKE